MVNIYNLYKKSCGSGGGWCEIQDVGKVFNGDLLTEEKYLQVEDEYVKSILCVVSELDIKSLKVVRSGGEIRDSINYERYLFGLPDDVFEGFSDGDWLSGGEVEVCLKLYLRGLLGFALTNDVDFFLWSWGEFRFQVGVDSEVNPSDFLSKNLLCELYAQYLRSDPDFEDYKGLLGGVE